MESKWFLIGGKPAFLERGGTLSCCHFLFWKLMPCRQKRELLRTLQLLSEKTAWR